MTLDTTDNQLVIFLLNVVAAILTCVPSACPKKKALLNALHPPFTDHLADSLTHNLFELPERIYLILDEYQEIQLSDIHQVVMSPAGYPLPKLNLAIAGCHCRGFSPVRLRDTLQLTEIRAYDLSFSDEAALHLLDLVIDNRTASHAGCLTTILIVFVMPSLSWIDAGFR